MATTVVHWERRDNDGWHKYDDSTVAAIQAAESKGDRIVQFVNRGKTYELEFRQDGPKQVSDSFNAGQCGSF